VPIVLTIGEVREMPAVAGGQVVVSPTLSVGVSFDHRVMDGYHAGRMAKRFREVLSDPERELGNQDAARTPKTGF
jgi:pyruvate dehydrogenase E2 component (dihydrolipoamide acetyltransferase)